MPDPAARRSTLQLARDLSVEGVKWAAAVVGGLTWRILFSLSLGMFLGLVFGIVYSRVVRGFGLQETLVSAGIPSFLHTPYFVFVGIVGFGLLGAARGIRSAAASAAGNLVDRIMRVIATCVRTSVGSEAAWSELRVEDIEATMNGLLEKIRPSEANNFVLRRVKARLLSVADAAKESVIAACRESAATEEDGTLKVDAMEAARRLARRRAEAASAAAVSQSLLGMRFVVGTLTLAFFALPLLFLLKG